MTSDLNAARLWVASTLGPLSAGDEVSWFAFPESADATVTSWIAPLKDSDQAELAKRFVQDVTGVAARKIFTEAGFAEPNEKFEG